jgi:hypothetical protein
MMVITLAFAACQVMAAEPAARGKTAPGPATPGAEPPRVTVLRMARQWTDTTKDPGGTIWRYYETWQTDVARTDNGELVRVEPYVFRKLAKAAGGAKRTAEIALAKTVIGSAFPPEGWQQSDFDDGDWQRQPGPLRTKYRSLALTCIRGKFAVKDPAAVSDLRLDLSFQGGAVAYFNGREVGRGGLPEAPIQPDTLAQDYPRETNESGLPKVLGGLINQTGYGWEVAGKDQAADELCRHLPAEARPRYIERYQKRFRALSVRVPAAALRKGTNVLAIEIHRAPAHPFMFTGAPWERDTDGHSISNLGWNRCMIDDLTLTVAAGCDAVVPNVSRPAGMQVWKASTQMMLRPLHYGDPHEPLRPIRVFGLRNGLYSGQFVVSSNRTLKGFKATASALHGAEGGMIPASNIEISYLQWTHREDNLSGFDAIDTLAPAEIAAGVHSSHDWRPPFQGALQPIWITVKVPRDARPGNYTAKVTVEAEGEKIVEVPLKLRVVSDWALPDPRQFTTFVGAIESPDSVALQYKVPLWSEAHWKLLDRTFALMAEIGVGDVHIPLLAKTNLGNEQSMVRWVKQPQGPSKPDFAIVERYLDTACKHLGKLPAVVLWIHDRPFYRGAGPMATAGQRREPKADIEILPYSEVDPATGQTREQQAPQWGTPEARTFWKPVIEGLRDLLARRGLERSMVFGAGTDGYAGPRCVEDTRALAPDVPWHNRTHGGVPHAVGPKGAQQPIRYNTQGHSCHLSVDWDPDAEAHYAWTSPPADGFLSTTSAWHLTDKAELSTFRTFAEATLLSRWCGISNQGVDFWPHLAPAAAGGSTLIERYTWQAGVDSLLTQRAMLGAGKDGPVATPRLRLMREALQEAEVRIVVQNALLDEAARTRLGSDLAQRCREVCDARTRMLRYFSWYLAPFKYGTITNYDRYFDETAWLGSSEQLDELVGPAAKALAK